MSDFEQIAREHRPRLVRIARSIVGDAAEDVAQVALLKAWQKYDTFNGQNLQGWINTIMRNTAFDYLRHTKRRPEGHLVDVGADDEGHPHGWLENISDMEVGHDSNTDHARDILRACDQLSDKQHDAIKLCAAGRSFPEIGRALGCSADAARDRVSRTRKTIQEFLN
ncbi:MAG: sigma-70 family RNA polymerase sigma factor [Sulfuricaulis sp.]|uniref:RNA polymerase sigma factor n=1 Tax=Sulfuricaulis sp. TaxID=2003553 RepID=UPI0025F5043C|nr:sigma-70 family RNA polymerase sigma factor [Sulfuricaulis sp.]MCR4346503.1 sigma-70 family RNA polymerase sigma factor [Sulfuricaulis sp.]